MSTEKFLADMKLKLLGIRNGDWITPVLEEIRTLVKAFGGCLFCYGKGYSTKFEHGTTRIVMDYCACERGAALQRLVEGRK